MPAQVSVKYAISGVRRKGRLPMGTESITEKILLYIEDNLDKELTLEDIAEEFRYSKFYLARIFKENTGVTLHKYIQGRRLDEAAKELAETKKPIAQIAFQAGYASQQAFTQAFGRAYVCTPQEYRRAGVFTPRQARLLMAAGRSGFMGFSVADLRDAYWQDLYWGFGGGRMAA